VSMSPTWLAVLSANMPRSLFVDFLHNEIAFAEVKENAVIKNRLKIYLYGIFI